MSKKKKIFLSSLIVLIVFVTSWVFPNEVYSSFENKAVEDIFIDEFQNPLFWSLYFIGNFIMAKIILIMIKYLSLPLKVWLVG